MARTIHRLTAVGVRNAKIGMHCDGGGLYLQCTEGTDKSIRRSWLFRYVINGRERQMGLGSTDDVDLAEARHRADECRKLRNNGTDPIEHRKAVQAQAALDAAKSMTFDECRDAYIKAHEASWRNAKHHQQWQNTLKTYCSPVFGKVPVQAIDVTLVLKVLEPIWPTKPETASRLRGRIESILDWAKARGLRLGENPARWRGHLDHLLPARSKVRKVKHQPALPYAELPAFMAALRKQEGVAARALEFTILTAARASMTTGATLDEIATREKLWTLSAERMKSDREHRVPLTGRGLELIEAMKIDGGDSKFIFPGGKQGMPLSDAAMAAVIDRMNEQNQKDGQPKWMDPRLGRPVVPHGFRSTFKDWASECTSFPDIVSEMALAHKVSDKVEPAYRRGELLEKRRRLMDAWGQFCATAPAKKDNIVSLRKQGG